ncbi:unnamed protein product, partial [Protopolystoma xenopodis]
MSGRQDDATGQEHWEPSTPEQDEEIGDLESHNIPAIHSMGTAINDVEEFEDIHLQNSQEYELDYEEQEERSYGWLLNPNNEAVLQTGSLEHNKRAPFCNATLQSWQTGGHNTFTDLREDKISSQMGGVMESANMIREISTIEEEREDEGGTEGVYEGRQAHTQCSVVAAVAEDWLDADSASGSRSARPGDLEVGQPMATIPGSSAIEVVEPVVDQRAAPLLSMTATTISPTVIHTANVASHDVGFDTPRAVTESDHEGRLTEYQVASSPGAIAKESIEPCITGSNQLLSSTGKPTGGLGATGGGQASPGLSTSVPTVQIKAAGRGVATDPGQPVGPGTTAPLSTVSATASVAAPTPTVTAIMRKDRQAGATEKRREAVVI